jgi:phytoene dehydrogenase-like protein
MRTRRRFLKDAAVAAAGTLGLGSCAPEGPARDFAVPGKVLGGWAARGHQLRDGGEPAASPVRIRQCATVIVGAGVAGLSAGDALDRAGHRDVLLIELGDRAGGNAHSGESPLSRFPWGAHYVPVIDPSDVPLRDFFARIGVIRDIRDDGLPVYEETMLCADPDERLWIHGQWQEGFLPTVGASPLDLSESRRFLGAVAGWRDAIGVDGRAAFALPIDRSSEDPRWRALDRQSFAEFLQGEGYRGAALGWYLDYCCRDDYGAPAAGVSAWAGLHYFAARRGRAVNATHSDVVTWPEGNGYLVRALAANLDGRLARSCVVRRVGVAAGQAVVDFVNAAGEPERVVAAGAILAVPRHVLQRLGPAVAPAGPPARHTPWVVANLSLSVRPGGAGAPLAWDNVVYRSRLLGYVVADHQRPGMPRDSVVITYYWPLDHLPENEARRFAERRSHADWCADFLGELYKVHPEVRGHVENLDLWIWGHGMVCPEPGVIWHAERERRLASRPPLHFCHSDGSGMSLFEEAFSLGQLAAARRLRQAA